jgi:hypothetical protein
LSFSAKLFPKLSAFKTDAIAAENIVPNLQQNFYFSKILSFSSSVASLDHCSDENRDSVVRGWHGLAGLGEAVATSAASASAAREKRSLSFSSRTGEKQNHKLSFASFSLSLICCCSTCVDLVV